MSTTTDTMAGKGRYTVSISLPHEDYAYLSSLMAVGDRSRSWLISRIIRWFRAQNGSVNDLQQGGYGHKVDGARGEAELDNSEGSTT